MPYQVSVMYDGKKIIPGPQIRLERVAERSGDGTLKSRRWRVTVSGDITPTMGSPDETGTFWEASGYPPDSTGAALLLDARIANFRTKLGALSDLFSTDGRWFEVYPGNGTAPIKFQPRWGDLTYQEGNWVSRVQWQITGETDAIYFGGSPLPEEGLIPEEAWTLERQDEVGRIYRLTHSLALSHRRKYDTDGTILAEGWEVARDHIIGGPLAPSGTVNQLGFASPMLTASGVLDLSGFAPYNYIRSQQIDESGGRFSVSEQWTCFNPSDLPTGLTGGVAIEEFTTEDRYNLDTGLRSATISGTVTGLEERNSTTFELVKTRWENAVLRTATLTENFAYTLLQTITGLTLNPKPLSVTIGRNKITGVVNYQYNFDTRPGNSDPSYLTEVISIEEDKAVDVFAKIPVPYRDAGSVLQPMYTVTDRVVTVNAEIVVQTQYGSTATQPTYDTLAKGLAYIGSTPSTLFIAADRVSWAEKQGRYRRSTTLLYQP